MHNQGSVIGDGPEGVPGEYNHVVVGVKMIVSRLKKIVCVTTGVSVLRATCFMPMLHLKWFPMATNNSYMQYNETSETLSSPTDASQGNSV